MIFRIERTVEHDVTEIYYIDPLEVTYIRECIKEVVVYFTSGHNLFFDYNDPGLSDFLLFFYNRVEA